MGAWRIWQLPDWRFLFGWDGDGQRIAADQESKRRGGTFRTAAIESERGKIQFVCGGGIFIMKSEKAYKTQKIGFKTKNRIQNVIGDLQQCESEKSKTAPAGGGR